MTAEEGLSVVEAERNVEILIAWRQRFDRLSMTSTIRILPTPVSKRTESPNSCGRVFDSAVLAG